MKKLFFSVAMLIVMGVSFSSCQKDISTLDGSLWEIASYDDLFDGAVVFSDSADGTVSPEYEDGQLVMYIRTWGWTAAYPYRPDEYKIIKYTDKELVVDFLYYEVPNVTKDDCTYIETYRGKKIYREDTEDDYYYYYFKGSVAIDLGYAADEFGDMYYYDSCRIHCRRSK
jgi:hypothetical protein